MKKLFFILLSVLFTLNVFAQIPCVVIKWDSAHENYIVANYNYNPQILPISGLAADYEVLVKRTPFVMPDFDSRLTMVGIQNEISVDFDSEYNTNRQWLTTYTLIDRSILDKQISVDESENNANYQVFPTQKQFKYIVLSLAIIDRKASGLTISAAQQSILDKLQDKGLKIWNNHIIGLSKKSELEAGYDVDLDSDFETIDPENE